MSGLIGSYIPFTKSQTQRYGGFFGTNSTATARSAVQTPFDSTIQEKPRDLSIAENTRDFYSFLTTNRNQTRDLRGDISAPPMGPVPTGAARPILGPWVPPARVRSYLW